MSLFDSSISRPSPGDWRWEKDSLAVVVRGKDGCAVICHVGGHVAEQIDAIGSNTDEIFEDEPPLGISIFKGRLHGGQKIYSPNGDDYADVYLRGMFRSPTPGEFVKIAEGECPWDPNEWVVP